MLNKGTVLASRYEIVERIGTGGMADVYRALDNKLNRYVAIKVLKREYREDSQFVSKFRAEARAVAGLTHPNIVNVYDVGNDDSVYYIVLELVEGITLKKYIEKKGHLPYKEAVSIAIQVANGLEAAHAHHIVHRDIKPQNIMISKEGKVKVADFGIAKAATNTTTVSTNAMGSVHYMSPEQARGGYSDERSDIYSFGITLYEMLTGQVPFDGDTTVAVAVHHIQDELSAPSEVISGIPLSVDKIVQKCTRKKTDLRYQSAEELIADLKKSLIMPDSDFVSGTDAAKEDVAADENNDASQAKQQSYDDTQDEDFDIIEEENKGKRFDGILKWIGIGIASALALLIVFFALRYSQTGSIFGTTPTETSESGVEMVGVPNVVGKTIEEATKTLEESGFIVRADSTSGEVGEQDPAAGTEIEKGSTIRISKALPTTAAVKVKNLPDLVGKTEDEALQEINAMKEDGYELNYKTNYLHNDDVPFGVVISTSPKAGEEVKDGRTVNITVSRGSQYEYVEVPELRDMTLSQVESTLSNRGLSFTYEGPEDGVVDTQEPAAGESILSNINVKLTMKERPSTTPAPTNTITVPSVTGMTLNQAISALGDRGLMYYYYGSESGVVTSQSPEAGSSVSEGSTVEITLSDRETTTTSETEATTTAGRMLEVPDVTGMKHDAAISALTAAGFSVNKNSDERESVVISQNPEGGYEAAEGSTVSITLRMQTPTTEQAPNDEAEESE